MKFVQFGWRFQHTLRVRMPYFDLNLPVPADAQTAKSFVDTAIQLGYDAIAFNHIVNKKLSPSDTCTIKQVPIESELAPQTACLRFPKDAPRFYQYSRITVTMDDAAQSHQLNPTNPILRSYDIFAVRPTTEKAFHAACLTVDGVDIISIDLTQKLPFQLKRPYIVGALARGISFEITIAPSLRDANARKNVIGNIFSLLRFSHGKGVIVASEAQRPIEMRSPADCINLCVMFGMKYARAKSALSDGCHSALMHGETRRTSKGVLAVEPLAVVAASAGRSWQVPPEQRTAGKVKPASSTKRPMEEAESDSPSDSDDEMNQ